MAQGVEWVFEIPIHRNSYPLQFLSTAQFVAVYYPGIDHMHAMIGSVFINRIGPSKQLGDTLTVATIPVLSKLAGANE